MLQLERALTAAERPGQLEAEGLAGDAAVAVAGIKPEVAATLQLSPGMAEIGTAQQQVGIESELKPLQPFGPGCVGQGEIPLLRQLARLGQEGQLLLDAAAEGVDRQAAQIRSPAPGRERAATPEVVGGQQLPQEGRADAAGLDPGLEGPIPATLQLGSDRTTHQSVKLPPEAIAPAGISHAGAQTAARQAQEARMVNGQIAVDTEGPQGKIALATEGALQAAEPGPGIEGHGQALERERSGLPAIAAGGGALRALEGDELQAAATPFQSKGQGLPELIKASLKPARRGRQLRHQPQASPVGSPHQGAAPDLREPQRPAAGVAEPQAQIRQQSLEGAAQGAIGIEPAGESRADEAVQAGKRIVAELNPAAQIAPRRTPTPLKGERQAGGGQQVLAAQLGEL